MNRITLKLLCMTALLLLPGSLHAQSGGPIGDRAVARKFGSLANELLEKGDYEGAIKAVLEAEKHARTPRLTVIAAQAHEKLGKLADAQRLFQSVVALDPQLKAPPGVDPWRWKLGLKEAQEIASAELLKLAPRVPRLTVSVTGADLGVVRVTVGGEAFDVAQLGREVPWNPGRYTITAELPGKEKASTEVELKEGEKKSVKLVLNRPQPPRPGISVPTGAIVAFSVGGVGLLVGAITGSMALEAFEEAPMRCPALECPRSSASYYHSTLAISYLSTVSFGVGLAGAATGGALLLFAPKKDTPSPVSVSAGPGFVTLRGAF